MATATRNRKTRLSDEDVANVLALIEDADSVELKLTVPETEHSSTVSALKMDPLDAQIRQVFFFDTPDLTLYEQGVVVRARRVQRKGDDSVVKLRPVVPSELPTRVRQSPDFGVEVDAMPGGYVCSGSMKGTPSVNVREAIGGERRLRKLFSKAQRAFYDEHAPDGLELDDLSVLGPIFVLKLKFAPKTLRPQPGSRDVALSRRLPHSRTLHQVSSRRGVPGRRGSEGFPGRARCRPRGRAGDEDPQGARVLLGEAEACWAARITMALHSDSVS